LSSGDPFDDQHGAGADGATQAGRLERLDVGRHAEQFSAAFERSTPSSVGKEAEVADADQTFGQHVKKKSAQELIC
jgi:hypothetical protein